MHIQIVLLNEFIFFKGGDELTHFLSPSSTPEVSFDEEFEQGECSGLARRDRYNVPGMKTAWNKVLTQEEKEAK